jgi:hypothetical protein
VKVTEGASTKDEKKATKRLIDSMNDWLDGHKNGDYNLVFKPD